ncbi:unnamed protein product [Clavelina lepadiformis]|uniref:Uncharacterized protein n=1 Tax=Clavelina lepadiformis TaxID=159417 RepID=A0ABP0G0Y7_CLALP
MKSNRVELTGFELAWNQWDGIIIFNLGLRNIFELRDDSSSLVLEIARSGALYARLLQFP